MRLTAVGTSGSFPGAGNAASCYLLTWEDGAREWRVVLDLGSGALGALQEYIDALELDAVVLSHLHPDHCLDMTGLFVRRVYDPAVFQTPPDSTSAPVIATAPLDVWGPAGTQERLTRAHHTDPGLSPDGDRAHPTDLGAAFAFRTVREAESFTIGGALFEPFLVRHPVECYALRITAPDGGVLVYSGDTDACDGLDRAAVDADLFLCEAAFEEERDLARDVHLTGLRAGETAVRAAVRHLVLTHIPPWTRTHVVRAEAESVYSGPLDIARPGDVWDIPPERTRL